jgi:hypothetical protein
MQTCATYLIALQGNTDILSPDLIGNPRKP